MKIAVLLSGSGTTLENIFEHIERGELPVEVAVVVSSRADAYGIERAKKRGVPTHVFARKKFASLSEYTDAVFGAVCDSGAELVALAGFMVQIGIPEDFKGRILNVHPALLPSFGGKGMYGHFVHEAVLEHGCKVSGCTVHVVDEEYDRGPIVMQQCVEVADDDTPDTLAERVQAAEREIYPRAIRAFAEGRVTLEGRRARVTER
ncbi:MAG: phosphoribosylglycinamide formyltransferase [Planctomycetota bacterium]|jgi:formyltetrahydrofolate-dependent phosphoribosylglycinamide formyltransferase